MAIRDLITSIRTHDEMKALIREGAFERATAALMEKIKDGKTTLTLSAEKNAGVTIPVLELGGGDLSVNLRAAERNGMSVWCDEQGTYHVTMMRTGEFSAGASLEGALDKMLEASAQGHVGGGRGCDLTFDSEAKCSQFVAAVLCKEATGESLALASEIRAASVFEIGGKVEAKIEADVSGVVDLVSGEEEPETVSSDDGAEDAGGEDDDDDSWLGFSAEFAAEGSVKWDKRVNTDTLERIRTRQGRVSFDASVSIAPDSVTENLTSASAFAAEHEFDGVSSTVNSVVDRNSLEFSHSSNIEIRDSLTYARHGNKTGILKSAESVSGIRMDNADDAVQALRKAGAGPRCIESVRKAAEKMNGEFTLEIVRRMPQEVVDRMNAEGTKIGNTKLCQLSEVRLRGIDASALQTMGITGEQYSLARTMGGSLERTSRFAATV